MLIKHDYWLGSAQRGITQLGRGWGWRCWNRFCTPCPGWRGHREPAGVSVNLWMDPLLFWSQLWQWIIDDLPWGDFGELLLLSVGPSYQQLSRWLISGCWPWKDTRGYTKSVSDRASGTMLETLHHHWNKLWSQQSWTGSFAQAPGCCFKTHKF